MSDKPFEGKGKVVITPTLRVVGHWTTDGEYIWTQEYDKGEDVPFEVETNPDLGVDVELNEVMFNQTVDIVIPEEIPEESDDSAWGTLPNQEP